MEEIDKIAVGKRIKEFVIQKYGKLKPLIDEMGMGYASFHSTYIKGRSLPGAKIISKLIKLGCDIDWLLHGEGEPVNKVAENSIKYQATNKEVTQLKEENKRLKEKLAGIQKLLDDINSTL